jgi:antitoxin Xre/MbcA/ParS-like protein
MALIFSPIGAILVLMVALPPRLTTADREPTEGALTAIKALSRVFKAWRVNGETAATLSGVSERTWTRMRSGAWSG